VDFIASYNKKISMELAAESWWTVRHYTDGCSGWARQKKSTTQLYSSPQELIGGQNHSRVYSAGGTYIKQG
jgi:hypothetical protein